MHTQAQGARPAESSDGAETTTEGPMARAITLAFLVCLSVSTAGASTPEKKSPEPAAPTAPAAATASDAAVCTDDATKAADQKKREAALAELGRRLASEPETEGEFRVLNRSGHNYGARKAPAGEPVAPPAKAAPDTKAK